MTLRSYFNTIVPCLSAGLLAFHLSTHDVQANTPATYEIDGKTFTVSGSVHDALLETSQKTGISYDILAAVCGMETQCDPAKVNKDSGACGLFQLNPGVETLYELLNNHGAEYGYEEQAKWVERYTRKQDENGNPVYGYRPVSKAAEEKVADLCLSPRFNALMYGAYIKPKIDDFNQWLATRETTLGEVLLITLLGKLGAKLFVKTAWDETTGNMLVIDFFKKHEDIFPGAASSNNGFVQNDDGEHRSVGTAYTMYQNMQLTEVAPQTQ